MAGSPTWGKISPACVQECEHGAERNRDQRHHHGQAVCGARLRQGACYRGDLPPPGMAECLRRRPSATSDTKGHLRRPRQQSAPTPSRASASSISACVSSRCASATSSMLPSPDCSGPWPAPNRGARGRYLDRSVGRNPAGALQRATAAIPLRAQIRRDLLRPGGLRADRGRLRGLTRLDRRQIASRGNAHLKPSA
jgi:hypothetical protein